MADAQRNKMKIGIMREVTQGVYVAPDSASAYVLPLGEGLELNPAIELLERDVITGHLGPVTSRQGMRSVEGAISLEAKASGVAGQEPQGGLLLEAALGAVRLIGTTSTSKASGNTASVIQIEDADISKYNVGDCVTLKMAGAYHTSPITAKSSGSGTATITLLIPHPSGDVSDSCVIEKCVTYRAADEGHPSFSYSVYINGTRLETSLGSRVKTLELVNWAVGANASWKFGFAGLDFNQSMTNIPHTPSYDESLPSTIQCAKVFKGSTEIIVKEVAFSLENTISEKTATRSCSGKLSSEITKVALTGSFTGYKSASDVDTYTSFVNGDEFSMFGCSYNPTGVPGEYKEVMAWYMPKCMVTEIAPSEDNGRLLEAVSFQATRGPNGSSDMLFISYI